MVYVCSTAAVHIPTLQVTVTEAWSTSRTCVRRHTLYALRKQFEPILKATLCNWALSPPGRAGTGTGLDFSKVSGPFGPG